MNKKIIPIVFWAVLSASGFAKAADVDGHLFAGAGMNHSFDSSFQAISPNQSSANLQLEWGITPFKPIEIYLMFGYGGANRGELFRTAESEIRLYDLELGLRYAYQAVSFMDMYAKLGGRWQRGVLGVANYVTDDTLKGNSDAFGGSLTIGLSFLVPRHIFQRWCGYSDDSFWAGSTFGFYIEGGGILQTAHKFNSMEPKNLDESSKTELKTTPLEFGQTNLSGLMWRVGAALYY